MLFRGGRPSIIAAATAGIVAGAAAGVLAAVAAPGVAQAAEPQPPTRSVTLPLPGAGDVVATADRVFVSGGAAGSEVVVADATGTVVGSISGLLGPADLLLGDDGRTLYVALYDDNSVAAFDTATLAQTGYYSAGTAGDCPSSLAMTGHRYLWFGYGCDQWGGGIGRIDLATSPATVTTGVVAHDYYDAPLLAAAAGNPGVLLAGQPALSPSSLYGYEVGADGSLTPRGENRSTVGSNLRDIALDRDGALAYAADGATRGTQTFPLPGLAGPLRAYRTAAYPNAVELSPDGSRLAAGADASYDPDVTVYTIPGRALVSFELGARLQNLAPGALAWSPDGTRLYAVTAELWGSRTNPATLHVLTVAG